MCFFLCLSVIIVIKLFRLNVILKTLYTTFSKEAQHGSLKQTSSIIQSTQTRRPCKQLLFLIMCKALSSWHPELRSAQITFRQTQAGWGLQLSDRGREMEEDTKEVRKKKHLGFHKNSRGAALILRLTVKRAIHGPKKWLKPSLLIKKVARLYMTKFSSLRSCHVVIKVFFPCAIATQPPGAN